MHDRLERNGTGRLPFENGPVYPTNTLKKSKRSMVKVRIDQARSNIKTETFEGPKSKPTTYNFTTSHMFCPQTYVPFQFVITVD